jgi:hypothetical protein
MALLEQARDMFMGDRFVFPGATKGSPLNPRALQALLHLQLREPYAVHEFRASFSTWAHERTEVPHELIELALAHVEGQGNAVARAYNRGDAIEKRRALMQVWGDFVAGAQVSNVVQFAAPARPLGDPGRKRAVHVPSKVETTPPSERPAQKNGRLAGGRRLFE